MVPTTQRSNRRQSTRRSTQPPMNGPGPTIAALPEAQVSSSTVHGPDTIEQTLAGPPALNPTQEVPKDKKPGLRVKPASDQANDDTEFLRGIGRGAQVWTTYVEEAREYDDDLVDGWNRSLDVTLVFAALFSAILTAFVLESVKNLSPDPSEVTAATLIEIANILRGPTGSPPTETSGPIDVAKFSPTVNAVWVNGLWFFSLSLSVAVSLAAMLAKQWCYYFLSARTGDPITQAEERQKRYNGLEKWRMKKILEFLPILMHLSLALFSVGLVLYLWDINVPVAAAVTSISLGALLFYLVTTLVPVRFEFCPFKTPQSHYTTTWLNALARGRTKLYAFLKKNIRNPKARISLAFEEWRSFWRLKISGDASTELPRTNVESSQDSTALWFTSLRRIFVSGAASARFVVQRFYKAGVIVFGRKSGLDPQEDHAEKAPEEEHRQEAVTFETDPASEGFVKDSLSWLIEHSQNSASIDTAIGALAIGRVKLDNEDLKQRINSRLVKGFSDCFVPSKNGIKLRLAHSNMMNQALDYTRWMSHFASQQNGIPDQVLSISKSLGIELVTHLGLAFACLAKQKPPSDVSKNIASWISSFIQCYDTDNAATSLYLSEEVLSVLVDGLTVAGLDVDRLNANERSESLAIPHIVSTLWKVSHRDESQLRLAIGLNLTVFALSTKLKYPMTSGANFDSAAAYFAFKYPSSKSKHEDVVPLIVFAILGLLYPENNIKLSSGIRYVACQLIQETNFLARNDFSISNAQLEGVNSLQRRMAATLIKVITQIASQPEITLRDEPDLQDEPARSDQTYDQYEHIGRIWLWITAAQPESHSVDSFITHKFQSMLHAVCHLINSHVYGNAKILPETLAASMNLLSEEITKLDGLDYGILDPSTFGELKSDVTLDQDSQNIMETPERNITDKRRASFTLACVISKSKNQQCIEAAVRSILYHTNHSSASLVVKAATRFAQVFSHSPTPSTPDGSVEEPRKGEQITASGYGRILASMTARCSEFEILAEALCQRPEAGDDGRNTYMDVQLQYERLAAETDNSDIRAFGVAGLAIWKFACPNQPFPAEDTRELLNKAWSLIAQRRLLPEALEALIDTTSLFSAIANPIPTMSPSDTISSTLCSAPIIATASMLAQVSNLTLSPDNAHQLLKILAEYRSELEGHVRPALAVALTFWGLSLDNWSFWTVLERRKYWRHYIQAEERIKDMAGLFLLGLSRLLENYARLLLNHGSISAIAYEIEHQMNDYSNRTGNLTLPFLSSLFDVRRHVRQIVGSYLRQTERYAPFTKSAAESRKRLLSAIETNGGEGYVYEEPQPFSRGEEGTSK